MSVEFGDSPPSHYPSSKATVTRRTFTMQKWYELSMCGFFSQVANYLQFCSGLFPSTGTYMISFKFKGKNMEKCLKNMIFYLDQMNLLYSFWYHF